MFSRSLACLSLNKFHVRYRCVEYALNAFGAHFKHASVRYMYNFTRYYFSNVPKACMRCANNVDVLL